MGGALSSVRAASGFAAMLRVPTDLLPIVADAFPFFEILSDVSEVPLC